MDSGVKYGSGHHGWQTHYDLPLDEAAIRYTDELWDYMGRLAQDCRIQGITPFTYDCAGGPNPEWWSFDQRPDALKNAHRAKKASEGIPQPGIFEWGDPPPPPLPPPPPPPAHAVEHLEGVLPWNVNGKRWKQRDPLDIVRVAVHHTSVDPKRDDYDYSVTHINAINRYHIQHNGWPRIGYHYCIDRVGRIFQVNSLRDISYHVGGYNARSIGVALFGALHQHDPTDEQVDALHWLRDFLDLPGIGHYELVPTKCPGPWWLVWKDCINQPYEPGPEPEPEPEPGAPYTMTITFQPGGSIFLIAGNYPLAWIPIELENEWGYLWRTTSGTKPEHGPGGFEFNVPNAGKYRFSAEGHAWDQFSIHEHGMISLAFS